MGTCGTRDPRLGNSCFSVEGAFLFLFAINLLNYVDRGIIPGAAEEFEAFISDAIDTARPNLYLGLLQVRDEMPCATVVCRLTVADLR
jgi:hypothetical protein